MSRNRVGFAALVCALIWAVAATAATATKTETKKAETKKSTSKASTGKKEPPDDFAGLKLRNIGPAVASGRIVDVAIHPADRNTWYVAAASGGVWKTTNAGTTWSPIFDDEGSYSIGCLAIDPKDPLVVWVGTGENNSQRSVGYGDGVYKSLDGGKSWKRMGLEKSEHIGMIRIDPRNSNVIWVAAQGPLWAPGGDRGLYRSDDGGATWTRKLQIDDWTGVSEIQVDPRDPDVLYAVSYQRARRVWALIDGGPGSGIHKSTDGGNTWRKLDNGLPKDDMGRIGLAISPVDHDVVYAIVEAANKGGGFYRSRDAGATWEKRSDYVATSPQYYQEIVADPKVRDRVYSMDTWLQVTDDGGKTFRRAGEKHKHVDNHVMWIDPDDNDHMIVGCDGGLYQTWDRCETWRYTPNLPITQFYKVAVDNALPFYNVYGGTQDNNTLGGPSRTNTDHGIRNDEWFVTVGGDGFQSQVDPEDPNIVYSEWQHGQLVRFDRRTGETVDIQPQPDPGEEGSRWNWDSPLIISPHSHTRLYFASQRLYRTDDRGDTWQAVSGDLTRRIDRNQLEVMGRVWSVDAVAKNASTSFYGNCVSLSESPLVEGLVYVGTDDGLVQVTEDGGKSWRRVEKFPGVPERAYVSRLEASRHDPSTVYAAFDNHKMGDFKPYVLRSTDRGKSWSAITGDLPERGTVYCLAQDHEMAGLLFAGTEFGVYFSREGGNRWHRLKGGMPTIAVRDLAIQRRENDLVVASFGRSFYVLDDYTPLRQATPQLLATDASLLPVKQASLFVPASPMGGRDQAERGDEYFVAPNPPFGAIFTYWLKDEIKTRRERRLDREKEVAKAGGNVFYPGWDSLKVEDREEAPTILFTITDPQGHVVRRMTGPVKKGFQRVAWDLRYPAADPTSLKPPDDERYSSPPIGPLVAPGTYRVVMAKRVDGVVTQLGEGRAFEVKPLIEGTLPVADRGQLLAFQRATARLQRAVLGTAASLREAGERIAYVKKALHDTPQADPALETEARALEARLADLREELNGDAVRRSRNEPVSPSIADRVDAIVEGGWYSTGNATATHRRAYDIASSQFAALLPKVRQLVEVDLKSLEDRAEGAGAPWTPGRVPTWTKD